MMRIYACMLMATIFAAVAVSAQAQIYRETWSGITATSPTATGTTTYPGGTFNTRINDGGRLNISTTGAFAGTTDTKYLSWNGLSDIVFNVTFTPSAPYLPGTDQVIQIAFPLRIDALSTSSALPNTIDVLQVDGNGANTTLFSVVVDNGVLRMSGNGFGSIAGPSVILSTDAFSTNTATNWDDGKWRVLVGRVTPGGVGAGAAKWWVIDTSGTTTILANSSGLSNSNVGLAAWRVELAHPIANPIGHDQIGLSLDNIALFSLAGYPNEFALLDAVRAEYNLPDPPVINAAQHWEMLE